MFRGNFPLAAIVLAVRPLVNVIMDLCRPPLEPVPGCTQVELSLSHPCSSNTSASAAAVTFCEEEEKDKAKERPTDQIGRPLGAQKVRSSRRHDIPYLSPLAPR